MATRAADVVVAATGYALHCGYGRCRADGCFSRRRSESGKARLGDVADGVTQVGSPNPGEADARSCWMNVVMWDAKTRDSNRCK